MKIFLISAAAAAVLLCGSAFSAVAADEPVTGGDIAAAEQQLADISDSSVSFKYTSYSFTGGEITPDARNGADEVTVTYNGSVLVKGVDYTVSYSNNTNVGYKTAVLSVTGIGDYTGTKDVPFTIKPEKSKLTGISSASSSIRVSWTESADALGYQLLYSPDPGFKANVLSKDVTGETAADLTDIPEAGVKWYVKVRPFITSDGTAAGVRYGSYSSVKSVTVKGSIAGVTTKYQKYTYKGKEIRPELTVTDSRGSVLDSSCYTAAYTNNINVGTAYVIVRGRGAYSGSVTHTFTVKPNDLSDNRATIPALEYIYVGTPVKPTPTLKVNGVKLTKDKDYTVSYSGNNAVGAATVTLTGMGNFSGSTCRTFTLKKPAPGVSTVNGVTYYADKNGEVERSVANSVITYSDKYLTSQMKSLFKKKGCTVTSALPAVDFKSVSKGSSNRKVVLTWGHELDGEFTSYLLFKGDTYGTSWKLLKEMKVTDAAADYKYTNNISSFNSRFFRYALAGMTVKDGKKYISPLTFETGWSKISICLDPGHYIGCNANEEYSEGTQMLLLGGKLRDSLTSVKLSGTAFANVKMTRTGSGMTETFAPGVYNEKFNSDYGFSLASRGTYAKGCDYFISLHTNATSTNSWYTPTFWEVQTYVNLHANANSFDKALAYEVGLAASKTIAPGGKTIDSRAPFTYSKVMNRLVSGSGAAYKAGDSYYAVNRAADKVGVPGFLIEHSFHTNPALRKWMLVDSNLAKLAKAECDVILKHYGFPIEA